MFKFIILFTVVPLLEFALLIKLSQYLGLIAAVSIVIITGLLGAVAANKQKLIVVQKIKQSMAQGQMPADKLIDGLLILIGSICLITPGLVTDLTGFLFILPVTRPKIKALTKSKFKQIITAGQFQFSPEDQEESKSVDINYSED